MNNSNQHSHFTAIDRKSISFPARIILNSKRLNGKILDFGCGLGTDTNFLKSQDFDIDRYDPFYFPTFPNQKYDTILCFYVLNVLLPEEQEKVLMEISKLLKPDGKAYFAVRRDIQYEGYRMHKFHKRESYQCQVKLPFKSIYKNENCEIYEYEHYTTLHQGKIDISPFFKEGAKHQLILENLDVFSFSDNFPVSPGHTLVIPKRKVSNYFDLTIAEQTACWKMVNEVKKEIVAKYKPDGFNVGLNIEKEAGQSIPHAHIHIIPRYKNDVENPLGGIRAVIPEKKLY
jgi:diadenosine tetraphosphate (Ap4A) HIT family hydrolase